MNKMDDLFSRLQAQQPPVIDDPDELTERIMQRIEGSMRNGSGESVEADSRVCPNGSRRPTLFVALRALSSAAAIWLIGVFFYVYSVPARQSQPTAMSATLSSVGNPQLMSSTLQNVRTSYLRSQQPQMLSYTQLKKQLYEKD
ncbi:MAG: hypothetical protein IKX44_03120 [Prevotella sp.]|nr:hypothetical protein [Prevotella sp.]